MADKPIIIDGVDVSELTSEQLACMNRYEVARLFTKLVDVLSETEDDYNNAQEDRVRMWTDSTGLTEKLKLKEQKCRKYKQTLIEIKEIAEEIENFAERIDEGNWGTLDWKIIDKSREILQKISEVLNDRQKQS